MAASASDYFKRTGNSTATSMASPGHSIGGTSITVGSTANWPTTTGVTFAIDSVTLSGTEEVQVPGTYTLWHGTVVGSTVTNMTLAAESPNSDQNYAAGSLTRVYIPVSAALHNKMVEGILVHADQDGTLKADSVDVTAVIKDNVVSNAKLSEFKPSEVLADYVVSGGVVAQTAGLTGSFSNMVHYIGGVRSTKTSVANKTYTASKDTYVDADVTANSIVVYTEVANGAASPALTAGYIRIAKVVTNGSAITSVVQSASDTLKNPIRPLYPITMPKLGNTCMTSVYLGTQMSNIAQNADTRISFDTKVFDIGSNFTLSPDYVFVAPVNGFYYASATVNWRSVNAGENITLNIKRNATTVLQKQLNIAASSFGAEAHTSGLVYMTAAQYLEVTTAHDGTGSAQDILNGSTSTYFQVFLVAAG